MAAAQAFGIENYSKLDSLTVSMKHPDAMASILSGFGEVTSHFTSPPYQFQELEKPGIRKILSSKDVVGDSSFIVAFTTSKYENENPKTVKAFMSALDESMTFINSNRQEAAAIYVKLTSGKEGDVASMVKILNDPDMVFTTTPKGMEKTADFMFRVGTVKSKPASWKDMFFPYIHDKPGS